MIQPSLIDNSRFPDYLKEIKSYLGMDLAELILGASKARIRKWINGEEEIDEHSQKIVLVAYECCKILQMVPKEDAKLWLVSWSNYMYGVPVKEVRSRPTDVIMASQHFVTRGEDSLD